MSRSLTLRPMLDQLSSQVSTVPFTEKECAKFLDILKTARGMSYHDTLLVVVPNPCYADVGRLHSPHMKWTIG